MKKQPACQQGKYGFQAHNDGGRAAGKVLLADDLQPVGNAHGKKACVAQGQRALQDRLPVWLFQHQHDNRRKGGADQRLNQVQPQTVYHIGVAVYHRDLQCKHNRAQNQKQIAYAEAAAVHAAEQVKSHYRQRHADCHIRAAFAAEEQPNHRHDHDIHGGEKGGFAGIGGNDSQLLQIYRQKQRHRSQKTCFPKGSVCPAGEKGFSVIFEAVGNQNYGKKPHYRQQAADRLKGKGTDIVHAHALGNKGTAPDHSSKRQSEAAQQSFVHKNHQAILYHILPGLAIAI